MSSALHRVRLNGKRSHNSSNNLNTIANYNLEESPLGGHGGGSGGVREKRARIGRSSQALNNINSNDPVPMSP
jgi:hypothetical protein